ncbi:hypothetical protein [Nocardioides pinisoli]|uniref:NAD(+)--protein-arginine ADP-ribosyltransferase n=1 Tax=Nocardioides pinisoli TaxID=2950279 RepID=A0ABT1KVU0_9ACTN|nr:hypothetical protein [Nocardioides pinisoli]MCP3420726.1 hypothetical protein [Nocardioides pinisoli]
MGNASSEDLDRKVAALLVALEKLPPHRGVSFRGRSLDSSFGREGQVIVTRELTATSRSVAVATENLTSPALYVVLGRTGRAIEDVSRHPAEREVVFLPASMFTVVKSARVDDLPVTIVEQLNPELGQLDEPLGSLEEIAAFTVEKVRQARDDGPVEITTPGKFVGDIA